MPKGQGEREEERQDSREEAGRDSCPGKSPEALEQVEDKAQPKRGSIENKCSTSSIKSCSPGSGGRTRDNCSPPTEREKHKEPPAFFHNQGLYESKELISCVHGWLPSTWPIVDAQ